MVKRTAERSTDNPGENETPTGSSQRTLWNDRIPNGLTTQRQTTRSGFGEPRSKQATEFTKSAWNDGILPSRKTYDVPSTARCRRSLLRPDCIPDGLTTQRQTTRSGFGDPRSKQHRVHRKPYGVTASCRHVKPRTPLDGKMPSFHAVASLHELTHANKKPPVGSQPGAKWKTAGAVTYAPSSGAT